ncbi:hypothetical protein [Erythrobacter oryzae]|uniref:hypothetical protein n=1 Tax=Erythrobacter oryzae TaxID=3019556 RepID=UPI0025564496|nr:hypothetical protein [Erythrobacter sp. COR-2]
MKTVIWIACGIGLNVAAAALHGGTAPQAMMTTGLAGTLPKLLLVATGNICIWRGLRSAVGDLWGVATGKSYRKPEARSRLGEDDAPVSDFDADEAFARYMEQRKAREEEPEPDNKPRPATPRPSPRAPAAPQRGFGRKAV